MLVCLRCVMSRSRSSSDAERNFTENAISSDGEKPEGVASVAASIVDVVIERRRMQAPRNEKWPDESIVVAN